MRKKYDVVLYGASGFVGAQTVAYFSDHAPPELRWAIAGRNPVKLEKVKRTFEGSGQPIEVLIADSRRKEDIESLVKQTRVILTTAGPFALCGENLVACCARYGVDYVDITGETMFVRDMMDRYGEQAEASGAKIIPFCGFDAVPSDLGVFIANHYIHETLKCKMRSARGYFSIKGGFNGGTLATLLNLFESGAWKLMKDPGILIPGNATASMLPRDEHHTRYDRDVRKWTAPFMMGAINTPVVNRSAALFSRWGEGYGSNFQYREFHQIGKWWNPFAALGITLTLKLLDRMGQYAPLRKFMKVAGPAPGKGPSEASMNEGFFHFDVIAVSEDGDKIQVRISHKGDPGNRGTVKFLCESALCLALDRDQLPGGAGRCGFLTPAVGLGHALIGRLRHAGISITETSMQAGNTDKRPLSELSAKGCS